MSYRLANFNFFAQNFFLQKYLELSDSCKKLVFGQKNFVGKKNFPGEPIFQKFRLFWSIFFPKMLRIVWFVQKLVLGQKKFSWAKKIPGTCRIFKNFDLPPILPLNNHIVQTISSSRPIP